MTKVCARHRDNPVTIYRDCVECEIERYHAKIKELQDQLSPKCRKDKAVAGLSPAPFAEMIRAKVRKGQGTTDREMWAAIFVATLPSGWQPFNKVAFDGMVENSVRFADAGVEKFRERWPA